VQVPFCQGVFGLLIMSKVVFILIYKVGQSGQSIHLPKSGYSP
jgi:hypothetical protein